MAERQVSSVPIVDRMKERRVVGVMALDQVLEARLRDVDEEHKLERVLHWLHIRPVGSGHVLVQNEPASERGSEPD
jgi:hypothetical protein